MRKISRFIAPIVAIGLALALNDTSINAHVSDRQDLGTHPLQVTIQLGSAGNLDSVRLDVSVARLPPGSVPDFYAVRPAEGGGYHRLQLLTASSGSLASLPEWIEAAPVLVGEDERFWPNPRFQPMSADGRSRPGTWCTNGLR